MTSLLDLLFRVALFALSFAAATGIVFGHLIGGWVETYRRLKEKRE